VLFDGHGRWSYVCVPAEVQPEYGEDLGFLDVGGGEVGNGPAFEGGWVGFLTYDFGLSLLGVRSRHKAKLPRMWWRFCDQVFAFLVTQEDSLEGEFLLRDFGPSLLPEEYAEKIEKIHEFERNGDSYQVNFAQEFRGEFEGDPFFLYCALFAANPSAMCFYAEDDGWAVCSNSPERLFSLRDGVVRAEPIKGTVGAEEDAGFLLKDEKSQAELSMIVDLLRNDLGRVARTGSVRVPKHAAVMDLKNVRHTYSAIEAELKNGLGASDILKALIPGGSVTGCPKKRTCEIIDELESFSRGAYCGSSGFVSVNGCADFNIMIRTATVADGRLVFPAGGGILIDSRAEDEYEETIKKVGVVKMLKMV